MQAAIGSHALTMLLQQAPELLGRVDHFVVRSVPELRVVDVFTMGFATLLHGSGSPASAP
jgi:hypothetical protein